MKRRLIAGCGYLGKRIAIDWQTGGDQVYVTTRSDRRAVELESAGLRPLVADVTHPDSLGKLGDLEFDTVLIAIGMDRSTGLGIQQVYVDGLANLLEVLSPTTGHLIYIGSTGVFGNFDGDWVDEQSPTKPVREGGIACLKAEQLLQNSHIAARSTILRLAGIYGPGRVPMRQKVADKQWDKLIPVGFLNLIHVQDASKVAQSVAELASRPKESDTVMNQTFLVSDGHPVLRQVYYEHLAGILGTGPASWPESQQSVAGTRSAANKRISNQKMKERLQYRFLFSDYRTGIPHALSASESV